MVKRQFKVIVAEDEALTRARITTLLGGHDDFSVIAEATNGREAILAIKQYQPDVILLDIKMPLLNGFDVLKKLEPGDYKILVFITAYDQYAIDAFEQEALDYLLKPFDQDRFELLLNRLRTRLNDFYHARDNYILVKENNELVRVKTSDIIYIQSDNNNVLIHIDGHTYKKRISLSLIQQQLNKHFIKIHRSYIINERKITKMRHISQGEYLFTMTNGKSVPSSLSYRDQVKNLTK